jgi:hypothetical protein
MIYSIFSWQAVLSIPLFCLPPILDGAKVSAYSRNVLQCNSTTFYLSVSLYRDDIRMYRRSYIFAIVLAAIAVLVTLSPQQKQEARARKLTPGRNNTALFISNSEHGQSNVFLATAQALLIHHPDIEIHYATFAKRAKDIASVNKYASLQLPTARNIIYHEIVSAPSFEDVMVSKGYTIERTINPPGFRGATQLCQDIQVYLSKFRISNSLPPANAFGVTAADSTSLFSVPWSGPEHIALFEEISQLIQEVDPSIIAVDTLFGPAMDATRHQNRRHAILSPNALINNFAEMQPSASILWKYPALGSSYCKLLSLFVSAIPRRWSPVCSSKNRSGA